MRDVFFEIKDVQIGGKTASDEEDFIFTDSPRPEISWRLGSDDPDCRQTAYQIRAADLNDRVVWDSGKVLSPQQHWIPWGGRELKVRERIRLQVKVWCGEIESSSGPVSFELALRRNSDWGDARWIWYGRIAYSTTPLSPYFRRDFEVKRQLERAVLHITARGVFEASLDGAKIGNDLLTPGWTDFRKQIPFQCYDVTRLLPPGKHALGAILADGWCCGNLTVLRKRNFYHPHPELLVRLELDYENGESEVICSNSDWNVSTGPILSSDLYDGENYDARLEMPGWDTASFDASDWFSATEGESAEDSPELVLRTAPPVRYMEELRPVRILNPQKDIHIWDFGQNFVGTYRIRIACQSGRLLTFRTAEMLNPDGTLYTLNYRGARSQDSYICAGEKDEPAEYIPKFTFHGFRYLQIDGFQFDGIEPEEIDVTGLVMHSSLPLTGDFSCGNELVNRFWKNTLWSQKGNFLELPTDCPQRDERLGWTGDAQVFAPTAMLNMDCRTFYPKYLRDIRDGMNPDGSAPSIAPQILNLYPGAAGWGDAIILIPYEYYRFYGRKQILEDNYDAMKRSLAWQKEHSDHLIRPGENEFGDWLAPEPTDRSLTSTAYFARCAYCLGEIAGILGHEEDRKHYGDLALRIAEAFRRKFTDPDGVAAPATQTALTLSLAFGLVLPDSVERNLDRLERKIAENGGRLSTGFMGTASILTVLERFGRSRTACGLMLQTECPSWLFPVTQGATTIWERWDSFTMEKGFGDAAMNSFNHYAYGAAARFLTEGIGGIHYSHGKLTLKIIPDPRFSPVRAVYDSPFGRIVSEWRTDNGRLSGWKAEVPPGIEACAVLPSGEKIALTPGRHVLVQST